MGSGREKRTGVGSVIGRSRLGTGDVNVDADADRIEIHQLYQHLVPHLLLKRVQIHLRILPLLLHHLNKFQWNLKLQRCHPPPPNHVPKDNNVNRNESNSKALTRRQRKALGLP